MKLKVAMKLKAGKRNEAEAGNDISLMTKEMKVKIYNIRMKENQKRNSMTKERSEKLKVPTRHTSWPDCCDEETNKQNTEK